jgi:hypothetical protein
VFQTLLLFAERTQLPYLYDKMICLVFSISKSISTDAQYFSHPLLKILDKVHESNPLEECWDPGNMHSEKYGSRVTFGALVEML